MYTQFLKAVIIPMLGFVLLTSFTSDLSSLSDTKTVGFWPDGGKPFYKNPVDEYLAWHEFNGATAIMLNASYAWPAELKQRAQDLRDAGYTLIMWGGIPIDNLWSGKAEVPCLLADESFSRNIDYLYVDEPFVSEDGDEGHWTANGFWSVLDMCRIFKKGIATSGYTVLDDLEPRQLDRTFREIQIYDGYYDSDLLRRWIAMPEFYYNFSEGQLEESISRVKDWAVEHMPRRMFRIIPWIAPNCWLGENSAPAWDCAPVRNVVTIESIVNKGFGGCFVFTPNGLPADHLVSLRAELRGPSGFNLTQLPGSLDPGETSRLTYLWPSGLAHP